MASLFYIATHGPDDPTKACIPFHLAVNGAAEAGIEVAINLAGDAAVLIQDRYIESLTPLGLPPLRELMAKVRERGIPIHI
jgi:predicted peroxiredoxin